MAPRERTVEAWRWPPVLDSLVKRIVEGERPSDRRNEDDAGGKRAVRESQIPDAAGEGAVRDTPRAQREDARRKMRSVRSPRYPGDDPENHHAVPDARNVWEASERMGSIAPVMGNPSIDPATGDLVAVSYMCGYGGEAMIGHDACDGVDRYVTGEADANENLRTQGWHGGTPLAMHPDESIMRDDRGSEDREASKPTEPTGGRNWGRGLQVAPDEGPMSDGWCKWL